MESFQLFYLILIKNIFILSTDVFATKPLWYNITDKYLGISSYKSGLLHPRCNPAAQLNVQNVGHVIAPSLGSRFQGRHLL